MKNLMRASLLTIFLISFLFFSCEEKADISNEEKADISNACHEGVIIGKIRSGGGGPAVTLNTPLFGPHEWHGYQNVVEALNLKSNYPAGTKIYFKARHATQSERTYIVTADGDESAKPIIYITEVSTETCPVY